MFYAVLTTDVSFPDIQRAAGFGILQMTAAGKTTLKACCQNSYHFPNAGKMSTHDIWALLLYQTLKKSNVNSQKKL